jgi:hypothetical protein
MWLLSHHMLWVAVQQQEFVSVCLIKTGHVSAITMEMALKDVETT